MRCSWHSCGEGALSILDVTDLNFHVAIAICWSSPWRLRYYLWKSPPPKVSCSSPRLKIDALALTSERGSFDKLVVIRAGRGAKKQEFQVHCGLISHYSIYFQAVLRDGSGDDIEIPSDDPKVVDTAIHWMYTTRFWSLGTSEDGKYRWLGNTSRSCSISRAGRACMCSKIPR